MFDRYELEVFQLGGQQTGLDLKQQIFEMTGVLPSRQQNHRIPCNSAHSRIN